uniref:Uncharacterized protein n=1 Tax=Tanacetum cinerariifolium TaxID=118510 RepID=A0A6L2NQP1_TANCI|nr:hypothetical protein [Tanacetum cinerariifolium]
MVTLINTFGHFMLNCGAQERLLSRVREYVKETINGINAGLEDWSTYIFRVVILQVAIKKKRQSQEARIAKTVEAWKIY